MPEEPARCGQEKGQALGHLSDYDVRAFLLALIAKHCPARKVCGPTSGRMGTWRECGVQCAALARLPKHDAPSLKLAPQVVFLLDSGCMAKPIRYTTAPWHTRMRPIYHFPPPSRILSGIEINAV